MAQRFLSRTCEPLHWRNVGTTSVTNALHAGVYLPGVLLNIPGLSIFRTEAANGVRYFVVCKVLNATSCFRIHSYVQQRCSVVSAEHRPMPLSIWFADPKNSNQGYGPFLRSAILSNDTCQ